MTAMSRAPGSGSAALLEPATPPEHTPPEHAWVSVCRYDDLEPERGVAALVGTEQVAVFRLHDGTLRAVDHHDPFSGANVLARGIVGSRDLIQTVASPMFKQVFDLGTGACLDDPAVRLRVFAVRVVAGVVQVGPAAPGEPAPAVTA